MKNGKMLKGLLLAVVPALFAFDAAAMTGDHACAVVGMEDVLGAAFPGTSKWDGAVRETLDPELQGYLNTNAAGMQLTGFVQMAAAKILLRYDADRDMHAAEEAAAALWVRVTRADNAKFAGLETVYALRHELMWRKGDWEGFDSRDELFPSFEIVERFVQVRNFEGLTADLEPKDVAGAAARAEQYEQGAAMKALRLRVANLSAESSVTASPDLTKLLAYVDEHFGAAGDELKALASGAIRLDGPVGHNRLKALGSQGVGVGASLVIAAAIGTDQLPLPDWFDLNMTNLLLTRIDFERMTSLYKDWFAVGDRQWRHSALRACQVYGELKWVPVAAAYNDSERTGGVLWNTGYLDLVELFLGDRHTARGATELVAQLVPNDGLSEGVAHRMGKLLAGSDRSLAAAALDALACAWRAQSTSPALLMGTESSHPQIRRACAWRLVEMGELSLARGFAGSEDVELRLAAVAAMVSPMPIDVYVNGKGKTSRAVFQPIDTKSFRAVESLLEDPDQGVREAMAANVQEIEYGAVPVSELLDSKFGVLRQHGVELLPEASDVDVTLAISKLVTDPDAEVRKALMWPGTAWSLEEWTQILTAMVADEDPEVSRFADDLIMSGSSSFEDLGTQVHTLFETILPLRFDANPVGPSDGSDERMGWTGFADQWRPTRGDSPFYLAFALENELDGMAMSLLSTELPGGAFQLPPVLDGLDAVQIRSLLRITSSPDYLIDMRYRFADANRKMPQILEAGLAAVPASILAEALQTELDQTGKPALWARMTVDSKLMSSGLSVQRERLFLGAQFEWDARLDAASRLDVMSVEGGPEAVKALLALAVADAASDQGAKLKEIAKLIKNMDHGNQVVLELLPSVGSLARQSTFFCDAYRSSGSDPVEASIGALELFMSDAALAEKVEFKAVHLALEQLANEEFDEREIELVLKASLEDGYTDGAVHVMHRNPSDAYFGRLCQIALTSGLSAKSAVYALGEIPTDATYEFLRSNVANMGRSSQTVAIQVLDEISRSRASLDRHGDAVLPSRDQAIAELIGLLDSKNAMSRAAAVRGIAKFGAPEALPRLIRMLEAEKDAKVIAALEAALDSLTSDEVAVD